MRHVKAEVEIMNMFGVKFGEKWIKALSSRLLKEKAGPIYKFIFTLKSKNIAALD